MLAARAGAGAAARAGVPRPGWSGGGHSSTLGQSQRVVPSTGGLVKLRIYSINTSGETYASNPLTLCPSPSKEREIWLGPTGPSPCGGLVPLRGGKPSAKKLER